MSCPHSDEERMLFEDVDNVLSEACYHCDELCHHNSRYDWEFDCLEEDDEYYG